MAGESGGKCTVKCAGRSAAGGVGRGRAAMPTATSATTPAAAATVHAIRLEEADAWVAACTWLRPASAERASPTSRSRSRGSLVRQLCSNSTMRGGVRRGQRGPRRLLRHDADDEVGDIVAGKGALAGEHLEEHAAERPDVGAFVDRLALRLLRAHVGGGPDDHAQPAGHRGHRRRQRRVRRALVGHRLGEAEIEDLDAVVGRELDVGRLQVAMDDPLLVRRVERLGDLRRDRQRFGDRNRPLARSDRLASALRPAPAPAL